MSKIIEHHSFVNLCKKDENIFNRFLDFKNLDDIIKFIKIESSEKNFEKYSVLYKDFEHPQRKFKGDLFEIIIEAFLKCEMYPRQIGIYDYVPVVSDEDLGVDGIGKGTDKKNLTVQVKFRDPFLKNEYGKVQELLEKDIRQFPLQSTIRYNVEPKTKDQNIVLITTAHDINHKTIAQYCYLIRLINYKDLKFYFGNNNAAIKKQFIEIFNNSYEEFPSISSFIPRKNY